MISSRYTQSKKKRKVIFSRKKVMRGGQIIPINTLETYIYVNLNVAGSAVSVNNVTNPLVKSIATNTPGSIILSVDPSLSTLADYSLFAYNGTTSAWAEIPRTNLDAGGSSVALYGNVPGMLIRKQKDASPSRASMEISIPVPASTYGNIMQFVNITDSVFGFTAANSPVTGTNVYVQLVFTNSYATTGTKLSGWLPTYIPGLSLWLNASEPGTGTFTPNTGVKMTNWTDKSGKNNHATAASETAPIYQNMAGGVGMGMYFNGSTFFSGNMQATGNYSYTFSVARPDPKSPTSGRILSLGATGADDSIAKSSIGVSASAGGIPTPATPRIVLGQGGAATSKIVYSNDGGVTWLSWKTSHSWPTAGSVTSIAYNGYMYVAVGNNATGDAQRVIQYSTDGMTWTLATPPATLAPYFGFVYNPETPSPSWVGSGGIKVVIYTGTMWICGGRGRDGSPAMAYSYNGINWILNTTTLPFTGAGDCITSIATNGTLIILAGFLKPSMAYSYDGINWFAMPAGVTTATQVANAPDFSGIHCVAWSSGYNMWIAAGDGGNPTDIMKAADANKKIVFSLDGFTWNAIANSGTSILADGIGTTYSAAFSITRIFSFIVNGVPRLILSGPPPFNNRGALGPLISIPQAPTTANPYGFKFTNCGGFPTNGNAPAEVSAAGRVGALAIYVGLQTVSGSSFLFSSINNGSSWTAIAGIPETTGPINAIVDNTNPNPNFIGNSYLNGTATAASITDKSTMIPYIVSAWTDGSNTCVAINGMQIPIYKVNPAQLNISSYMVGKNQGTNYNNYQGYIYEILNFNGFIYAVARRVIEGYLSWKWAIQSLLPASHPFYRNPPTKYSITTPWPVIFQDLQPLLWLDGQDPNGTESVPPPDRTLISTWYDKSGNGNNLKAPRGGEPMFRTNMLSGGAIQFNRYPYQSMSIISVPLATDTLPTTDMIFSGSQPYTLTPSAWIPGFGGFSGPYASAAEVPQGATYDNYGFVYIGWINSGKAQIIQYDENNTQTRMLYFHSNYRNLRSMCIGPISGCIYVALETAVAGNSPFMVLTPDSLPITASTIYKVTYPTLYNSAGTQVNMTNVGSGVGALTVDENETIYLGFYTAPVYVFPYTSFTYTSGCVTGMKASLVFTQAAISYMCMFTYSPFGNSLSYAPSNMVGRVYLYLNTVSVFKGGISGTALAVSSITSGTILLGSTLNTATGGTILAQLSGLSGGTGVYTVSATQTVAADTSIMSVYVAIQLGNHPTRSNTVSKDGILNASNMSDPVAISSYNSPAINELNNKTETYDPAGNYLYMIADTVPVGRLKRINIQTGQVITLAGSVNNLTAGGGGTALSYVPLTSERFPVVYEVGSTTVYDTPVSGINSQQPIIMGKQSLYLPTYTEGATTAFKQVGKITNPRATSSCMSAPMTLTGPTVSVFIVYINTNTSKNIMPHRAGYQSPILSLSATSDHNVFKGGILGTVLTVTSITSGKIELGATINTPLGGFISSQSSGSAGGVGTYVVGISQYVPAGTTISSSNGIDAINNTVVPTTPVGATVTGVADTNSSSFISLYAKNTGTTVFRKNSATGYVASTNLDIASQNPPPWPASGLPTVFTGTIAGTVLTVTNIISGCIQVGAVLDTPSGGIITGPGTGNGTKIGTYYISVSQTVATATTITATMPPILPELLFYSCSPTAVKTRVNGGATVTTAGSFSPLNVSAIGLGLQPSNISRKESLLPNYFFDGVICEVLVYNTDLTTDAMRLSLMEGYLAWKWGIQSNLPGIHMYKTITPTDFIAPAPGAITSATVSNLSDYGFIINWSGGNGATTYTYDVSPEVSTLAFNNNGLTSKSATISGLQMGTTYTLTINANSTLKTTSFPKTITTRVYTAAYYSGGNLATYTNTDTLSGPVLNALHTTIDVMLCDVYNNIYAFTSWGNFKVIIPSLNNVQTVIPKGATNPMFAGMPARGSVGLNRLTGDILNYSYVNPLPGKFYLTRPSEFPLKTDATNKITTTWTVTAFTLAAGQTPIYGMDVRGIEQFSTDSSSFYLFQNSVCNLYKFKLNFSENTYTYSIVYTFPTAVKRGDYYIMTMDSVNGYFLCGGGGDGLVWVYNYINNFAYYICGSGIWSGSKYVYSYNNTNITSPLVISGSIAFSRDVLGNLVFIFGNMLKRIILNGVDLTDKRAVNTAFINSLNTRPLFSPTASDNAYVSTISGMPAGYGANFYTYITFDMNNSIYTTTKGRPEGYDFNTGIIKFSLQ
jgi:hypothetical protein